MYYDANAASNGDFNVYTIKRFFVMKHFSQFIPVGSIRHAVQGISDPIRAMAFKTSSGWSLIVMNMGSSSGVFGLPTGLGQVRQAIQTSPATDWTSLAVVQAPANVTLPGLSITTFLFQ